MLDVAEAVARQKEYFRTGETLSFDFRIYELKKLRKAVKHYEDKLMEALRKDLGKCSFEAFSTEIGLVYSAISDAESHVRSWMRPKRPHTPLMNFGAHTRVYPQPKGVVLIMSPWNYPVALTLIPLVSAVAAGNCCVIKPSRYSENTTDVLYEMIKNYFNPRFICLFDGGREVNSALLEQDFDHIFFTGSPRIGRIVMKAAAERLTPVTLELGGKNPCIVDDSADIDRAAKRIVWGKCINSGQTCVAPDYVLLHSQVRTPFIEACIKYIKQFYGENPLESSEYARILKNEQLARLTGLLENENVLFGGQYDEKTHRMAPAIVETDESSPLMEEEIFGPVLPLIVFNALDEAYEIIDRHPNPLALYVFTTRKHTAKHIIDRIPFGGGCVNDTIMHMTCDNVPFGGVRQSGIGMYHGKYGFDTFSHMKTVVHRGRTELNVKYPPYGDKIGFVRKILK